ncbi:solute carrier family 2, facilitated glucose transporter member 5-like isoform X1 [Crotalus tigris]|uniref:solute carrier family 2, facilitated glucose transporter member 5-like isoform X1 n=2 Tax=Crotalus tigris TaxID=88082 RepID=UPI00192F970E|nr:solute carrier family 2, facilitated glucose transporter member 5-like isoform X1 [Crotalus tigris]
MEMYANHLLTANRFSRNVPASFARLGFIGCSSVRSKQNQGEQIRLVPFHAMTHKKPQVPLGQPRRIDNKEKPKPTIRDYLTGTLIMSMSVSYLGHFEYGYTLILVHHPASLFVANLTKEEVKNLKHFWFILSPAVIFFPMGGFIGIVLFANLVDKYGRKYLLLFNNTLTFVVSIFLCISNSIRLFEFTLFANFMTGICSGIFSCCDPLYLIEVSPTPIRGSITAASAFFFSLGVILGYTLGLPHMLGNEEGFPFMAILLGLIATICILLLLICPESPRFIFIQKKNETKATEVLRSLRAQGDVMNEIKDLQEEDFYELKANEKNMTFWKFLHARNFRWPIVTTIVLMAGSQLSGINGMFFYAKRVYVVMGLSKPISEIISLSINLIILITIIASINLIEMWGRRIPLIMGLMICSMACILLTLALEFQVQSPPVSFLSLVFIIIFLIGHMIGPGPIRVVILGELFLQSTRALAFTIGFSALWFSRFVSGMILIQLELLLGPYSLLVYWPFCVATFIYLFKMLPESKGKTFVAIQLAQKEEKGN